MTPRFDAHLRASVMPATAGLAIPWWLARGDASWSTPRSLGGAIAVALGWALVAWTVLLFARRGRGTLAPWNPPRRLVTEGPFAHVRNPMISGVALAIIGTAVATGSLRVAYWALTFVGVNHLYFVAFEEPGLRRRFGAEYLAYAAEVPRWVPRWSRARSRHAAPSRQR